MGFSEIGSEMLDGLVVSQVSVWIKDIEFKPTAYGQNRVTNGDIGDARKGAQTDALKKALSYFSVGNRAYRGLLQASKPSPRSAPAPARAQVAPKDDDAASEQQLHSIRQLSQRLGKEVPGGSITFGQARQMIMDLSREYNERKNAG